MSEAVEFVLIGIFGLICYWRGRVHGARSVHRQLDTVFGRKSD